MYTPFLQIEPTTRCNYTCGFCAGRSLPQLNMSLETFQSIIDAVEGLAHVELQGEGEPLINPHFFTMVQILRKKFPDVMISMITNGSLLTPENIQLILAHRINKVMVSVESAEPETFRRIRGGKFSRVERGVKALMHARETARQGLPEVGLAITVLKDTVDHLPAISQWYQRVALDGGVTVQLLNSMSCYTQYYDDEMLGQIPGTSEVERFNQWATDKVVTDNFSKVGKVSGFYHHLYAARSSPAVCPWLENGLYITADGTACACCMMKDSRDGFATFDASNVLAIEQQRRSLLTDLQLGNIPASCAGCATAKHVARQAKVKVSPSLGT